MPLPTMYGPIKIVAVLWLQSVAAVPSPLDCMSPDWDKFGDRIMVLYRSGKKRYREYRLSRMKARQYKQRKFWPESVRLHYGICRES